MAHVARKRPSAARRHRRGAVVAWLVIALGTLMTMLALGLDLAWVWRHHLQLQAACEAGALAGAPELMDPSPLYPNGGRGALPSPPVASYVVPAAARIERARRQAVRFAGLDGMVGEPLVVDDDGGGPGGDLVAGWLENPSVPGSPMEPWTGRGPVNSLWVRAARTRKRANPITLWFGRVAGVACAEAAASARATVDQRVYGFRPAGHVRVPMVPILSTEGLRAWLPSRSAGEMQDRVAVDVHTGEIQPAPDGIPEIVLRIAGQQSSGSDSGGCQESACLVSLTGEAPALGVVQEQVRYGLRREDLEALGGQLSLRGDGGLVLAVAPAPPAGYLAGLQAALLDARGQPRVWPVGERAAGTTAGTTAGATCRVVSFTAGCVVDCTLRKGCLEIVVQPCLLRTCTALVGEGVTRNPWVGKLVLTQ